MCQNEIVVDSDHREACCESIALLRHSSELVLSLSSESRGDLIFMIFVHADSSIPNVPFSIVRRYPPYTEWKDFLADKSAESHE